MTRFFKMLNSVNYVQLLCNNNTNNNSKMSLKGIMNEFDHRILAVTRKV